MSVNYENTYWNHKGKHEEMHTVLLNHVPTSGEVPFKNTVPALEKLRIASNCYYDLYNNGLCNRAEEFEQVFEFVPGTHDELDQDTIDRTETKMDEIILAAYAEQFPHLNKLREIGVIATSSEDGPPTRCPYCGGTDITELEQWAAVSEDGESNETLVEWQCVNACGGRAFWV